VADPAPSPPTQRPPAQPNQPQQSQQQQKPPMIPRSRGWLAFIFGLLLLNLILSFTTGGPVSRQQVPYQPFFINQLKAGNVKEITSQADSIEGELKKTASFTAPSSTKAVKVTLFKTQVPSFIDRGGLTKLVTDKNVFVNAAGPAAHDPARRLLHMDLPTPGVGRRRRLPRRLRSGDSPPCDEGR
jgi:hypothetical protein